MLPMVLLDKYPAADLVDTGIRLPDRNGDGWITPDEWLKACPCFNAGGGMVFEWDYVIPNGKR